jgi:nicotinamide mononucleotide transporter
VSHGPPVLQAIVSAWDASSAAERVAVALGLTYSLLAVWRSRWCWIAGGVSSALFIYLALRSRLPMQAALQVYYVAISAYGWWHWSHEEQTQGAPRVSTWGLGSHLLALAGICTLSALSGYWLTEETSAAWPLLDSATTWASLLATWLTARVKLENWLYWIAIDSVLAFLFGAQGLYLAALLSVVYLGVSTVGFVRWLRTYRTPAAAS